MKRLLLGMALSAFAGAASADDVPVLGKMSPTIVSAGGWYVSLDGAWQSINLPDYGLGFHKVAAPTFPDAGPFQTFKPQLDAYLFRGAIGYFLPPAASNTFFGANTRVEIGGFYAGATGSDNGTATFTDGGVVTENFDGTGKSSGYVCSLAQVCTTTSKLSTDYSNWQLHGKVAGDYHWGSVLVTPSLAVFAGDAHVDQAMSQSLNLSVTPRLATYNGSTSLRWTDLGARAGLDLKVDLTPRWAVSLGGSAGFAVRHAALSGSDVAVDSITGANILTGAGTISTDADATAFVANAEAGVAFKWLPTLTVRGFAGLDFDSEVPGVAGPSFAGGLFTTPTRSPGSISFQDETSLYVGSGATWTF